jgi:hypothetical protein
MTSLVALMMWSGLGGSSHRHLDDDQATKAGLVALIRRIRNWSDSGHAGRLVGKAALDPFLHSLDPYRSSPLWQGLYFPRRCAVCNNS